MKEARIVFLVFLLGIMKCVQAQVATGTPWFGSFGGGPDVVNLGNLNVNWSFPLVSKPGRGLPFELSPSLDSSIWYPVTSSGVTSWQPLSSWGWSGLPGGNGGKLTYNVQVLGPFPCGPSPDQYTITQYSNYVYTEPTGTPHVFNGLTTSTTSGQCQGLVPPGTPSSTATDGTGYSILAVLGFGYITNSAGQAVSWANSGANSTQEDSNGNYISCSSGSCVDTLGVQETTVTGNSTAPPMTVVVGGSQTYTINYTNYTVQTHFNCSSVQEYGPTTVPLVSSIELPNGKKYTIEYEPSGSPGSGTYTGRIHKITLPSDSSGPTIVYDYSGGDSGTGIYCADGSTPTLTRTTPDGQWTYTRSQAGATWTTKVSAPAAQPGGSTDETQVQFLPGVSPSTNLYEIGRQVYSGSVLGGSLLETVLTCYSSSATGCRTSYSSSYSDSGGTKTSIGALSARVVTTQLSTGSSTVSAGTIDQYDSNGNLYEHDTYDFGAPGSGTFGGALQKHTTLYNTLTDFSDATTGAQLSNVSRLWKDYVVDGSGNLISYLENKFDESTTSSSGAPHRSSGICPSGACALGNVTSTYRWISGGNPTVNGISGTSYLKTTFTNYDTGLPSIVTDPNGAQTAYTYGSSSCGAAFPTSISTQTGNSVGSLQTSATWDCDGGVQLTSVDPNGNTTTYTHSDPFWRVTSATNNATGAVTSYSYPSSSSNSSSSSMNFYGGSSTTATETTYDRLGRPTLQQTLQSPNWGGYDTITIAYDGRGRAYYQSLPYSGTSGQSSTSGPGVTTTFDALNRPSSVTDSGGGTVTYTYTGNDTLVTVGPAPSSENSKKRSLEYNGAGWLTSVCEVTAGTTLWPGGSCGQTSTTNTGYLTKYAYDGGGRLTQSRQNAQSGSNVQTRSVSYDGLSRKLAETIPEWSAGSGSPGTTYYTYDTESTSCSITSKGDLVKTIDNAGNVTCLTYDLQHRLVSSKVVSGTYASVTPQSYYVYDAASHSGTSMQNAKGNLAEAYTCTGSCTSKLTDEFFSTSPIASGTEAGGVLAQVWQSTPNSGGYFLTQDSYYPNGALGRRTSVLGSSSYGYPNMNYGLDGEGRPYWAADSSRCINPVTSTSYNSASSPTNITFGNASTGSGSDVDSFDYDPNTGRPLTASYVVNPASSPFQLHTALAWNANGSLNQMALTDSNDGTKNQSCQYTADDLGRIASVGCGSSTWAQNFAYDPFGNIQKSGSVSYGANYSASTNQVSSGITPGIGYDLNGNQLNSTGLSSISWNAAGQTISATPLSGGPISGTYDALGRLVETGAGTYTEFVYSPSGQKIAVVQSGTLVKGTVPLPGGATAIYSGTSGMPYIRHTDWLGSSRLATTWAHGVQSKEAYAPFGEIYNESGTPDRSFTGQDQDVVSSSGGTGIYEFMFRKYDPSAGRWLSPDPSGWAASSQGDPQSMNRYSYVTNRPMSLIDPNGLDCIYVAGGGTVSISSFDSEPSCAFNGGTWYQGSLSMDPDWYISLASSQYGAAAALNFPNGDLTNGSLGFSIMSLRIGGIPSDMYGCGPSNNLICSQIYNSLPDWGQAGWNFNQSTMGFFSGSFDYSGLANSIKSCAVGSALPTIADDLSPFPSLSLSGALSAGQDYASWMSSSYSLATGVHAMERNLIMPLKGKPTQFAADRAIFWGKLAGKATEINAAFAGIDTAATIIKECN